MVQAKKRPTCFISYCHEDTNPQAIALLVQELKETAGQDIEVHWDGDQATGTDLDGFMDELYSSHVVILLLSPAYKRKVDSKSGGVYDEYSRIMGRLDAMEALRRKPAKSTDENLELRRLSFSLLPYIFAGTAEAACPAEFSRLKYSLLSGWHVFRTQSGEYYVPESTKRQYRPELQLIARLAQTNFQASDPDYSKLFDDVFQKLFRNVKHEDAKGFLDENPNIARRLFVKTYAYKLVKKQQAYVLTGRKGSGKTTLTEYLAQLQASRYKQHLPIKIDDFELETIAEELHRPQAESDTKYVIRRERVLRVAWEIFLFIHCMDIVIREQHAQKLTESQEAAIPRVAQFLQTAFQYQAGPLRQSAVYRWALSKVIKQVNAAIDNARATESAEFEFDIDTGVSSDALLTAVIPSEVLFSFANILRECKRRFLISLDGFDRNFDEFRRIAKRSGLPPEELSKVAALEKDWVRSLLYLCREIKRDKDRWGLFPLIDFCVTIPKDRCIEILNDERDAVAYLGRIWEIKWTGIELAIMLRKRLEILFAEEVDRNGTPVERLLEVTERGMKKLPKLTVTRVGGREYQLPIFIDILRHTFWRPRDVLMYVTAIVASYIHFTKRGIEIDWAIINKKVSDTTFDVIDKEFISEFQTTFLNIRDVISSFSGLPQTFPVSVLDSVIGPIQFDIADSLQTFSDIKSKARLLLEIGFLGLRVPKDISDRFKLLSDEVFYFNDGRSLERLLSDNLWRSCDIIIHPIFCEYLGLDTSKQNLTLEYSFEYLRRQDAIEGVAIAH